MKPFSLEPIEQKHAETSDSGPAVEHSSINAADCDFDDVPDGGMWAYMAILGGFVCRCRRVEALTTGDTQMAGRIHYFRLLHVVWHIPGLLYCHLVFVLVQYQLDRVYSSKSARIPTSSID